MDLRIQRTQKSIINAFIELRAKKPLEKITVKELADKAFINKATFYQHYKDIYDLSETLEQETIESILNDIPRPDYFLTNPKQGIKDLTSSIVSQNELINILFSGTRQTRLLSCLEFEIKKSIYDKYPEYKNNLKKDLMLTVLIQGLFHAFLNHRNDDFETVIDILGKIADCLIINYK